MAGATVGLALALPVEAGAAAPVVKLKIGDGFVVTGSHVVCAAQVSKTLLPGDRVIGCAYSDSKGPVVGTYEVALAANGLAAIAKVKTDGSPSVVYRRTPAVAGSQARIYNVKSGAVVFVTGTNIACSSASRRPALPPRASHSAFRRPMRSRIRSASASPTRSPTWSASTRSRSGPDQGPAAEEVTPGGPVP